MRTRLTSVVAGVLLAGCSNNGSNDGSGNNNSNNGDVNSLQIITPKIIYSRPGTVGTGYVVINNPTEAPVKNVHYSLTSLVGAASMDSASAANCATVSAYSQCNIKILVPAGAIAGSFKFGASNDDDSLLSKSATTTPSLTVGVEQAAYNTVNGANGITLSYFHTVINGTPYILVSGLIASPNVGSFNKVVLVNNNGIAIPNQEIIGAISNAQGSTFNILLPVPSGNNITQTIKVQTQQVTEGKIAIVSTATSSSTLITRENVGIVEALPSAVYLTESNPEQIATFVNIGDRAAQLQQLISNNPNVEVEFSPSSLVTNETAMATLKLKDKKAPGTSGDVILAYSNGQSQSNATIVVNQNVTPTPTPTPAPPPPLAGLTAIFSPNNDFFTTTAIGAVSNQLTLTNSGNTDEDAIVLTLPANFSISSGSSNSCTVTRGTSPATISDSLSANSDSCTVTVTYTNNTATSQASNNINIAYQYNNSMPTPTPTIAAVNYRVDQSTANLVLLSPASPFIFPTTLVDGANTSESQIFTIKNTGEVDTTSMSSVVNSTTTAELFSSTTTGVTSTCGVMLTPNATCEYGIQFGPIPDNTPAGSKAGNLTISYKTYPATTQTTDLAASFSGEVATSGNAIFNAPSSGTAGGGFTGMWPNLSIAQNTTGADATVTYTITNTGEDAATDFVVTLPNAPAGWSTPTTNCPTTTGTNLAKNASCAVSITSDTTTATTISTPTMTVGLAWSDQANPTGKTQNMQLSLPQVMVVPPGATITIAPVTGWQTMMGSAYVFTAIVTDGSSTVTPIVSGLTGDTVSPSSCDLDSAGTASCTFIVTAYTGTGNYSYWDPASVANSNDVNSPSSAYNQSGISLTVNATNNATINGSTSPQIFSSITGTVIAPYVYLPQTGQTPGAPLDVSSTVGADGNVHVGISWAYVTTGNTDPNPRFEEVDGGTCIRDKLTGLIWVKDLNTVNGGNILNWDTALTTAAAGTWCGQNAGTWRLPNVNELRSLANYSYNSQPEWLMYGSGSSGSPACNGACFANVKVATGLLAVMLVILTARGSSI